MKYRYAVHDKGQLMLCMFALYLGPFVGSVLGLWLMLQGQRRIWG